MISQTTCFVIGCDECGMDMYDASEWGTPHYDSEAEALAQIKPCSEGDDGDALILHRQGDRVLCTKCAHEADCARDGHQWGDWYPPSNGREMRICDHCDEGEFRPAERGQANG